MSTHGPRGDERHTENRTEGQTEGRTEDRSENGTGSQSERQSEDRTENRDGGRTEGRDGPHRAAVSDTESRHSAEEKRTERQMWWYLAYFLFGIHLVAFVMIFAVRHGH